jgi:hypothetical protein
VDQHVEPEADHRYGSLTVRLVHGGVSDVTRIHDRQATAADGGDGVLRIEEGPGVLVHPDPDELRVVGKRGDEAAQAIALAEVLIHHQAVGQAEAGSEGDHAESGRLAVTPEGDHVRGDEGRAGGRPRHVEPLLVPAHERLGERRPSDDRRQSELVAAGQEHAVGPLEDLEVLGSPAVRAPLHVEQLHRAHLEIAKEPDVVPAGLLQA